MSRRWQISRRGGARSLSVVYSVQCGGLEDDFSVASSRRNRSLPMGTYLHSQRSRVHWASGKWATVLPEYSTPNCASTASQASRPGKIRTPRNNPDLCAFLSARIERAICDGVLRIGALIVAPEKCLQTLEFNLIVELIGIYSYCQGKSNQITPKTAIISLAYGRTEGTAGNIDFGRRGGRQHGCRCKRSNSLGRSTARSRAARTGERLAGMFG